MAEKVSKKTMKRIHDALRIPLDDVEEFESLLRTRLFEFPPDRWSDDERAICDYQNRIESRMIQKVREILGFDSPLQGDGETKQQPPSED